MDATLNPREFLHVDDKQFPEYVEYDDQLKSGPQYLYIMLFHYARKSGICRFTQKIIAGKCKDSIRTVQTHIKALVALRYLSVEPDAERPGCKCYRLILSARVRRFIELMKREKTAARQAQNPYEEDENSARIYKSNKSINTTPLSPLPPRHPAYSAPTSTAGGRGDSFSCSKKAASPDAAMAFERFFASYPRKDAREAARSEWLRQWRSGGLPEQAGLFSALERFCQSKMWQRENGRFVPYLVNWLRGRRWLDAPAQAADVQAQAEKTPEKAEAARMELPKRRPDPGEAQSRMEFETFMAGFDSKRRAKLGPAWGLWNLLRRLGSVPKASDARESEDIFEFLRRWKDERLRECHAA